MFEDWYNNDTSLQLEKSWKGIFVYILNIDFCIDYNQCIIIRQYILFIAYINNSTHSDKQRNDIVQENIKSPRLQKYFSKNKKHFKIQHFQ